MYMHKCVCGSPALHFPSSAKVESDDLMPGFEPVEPKKRGGGGLQTWPGKPYRHNYGFKGS